MSATRVAAAGGLAWRAARWVAAGEVRTYVGLLRLLGRRHDVPPDATPHRYVGAVGALLWGITGVSAVELVVLHLVLPWERVRLVADVVGIWGLVWCAGLTGCHYVYPHLVTPEGLRVRHTRREDVVSLPWDRIAAVSTTERSHESSRRVQVEDATVLVVVGNRTNVEVRLRRPVEVRVGDDTHLVERVRLQADEPRQLADQVRTRAGGAPVRS